MWAKLNTMNKPIKLIEDNGPQDELTLAQHIELGHPLLVQTQNRHGKHEYSVVKFKSVRHLENYERMQMRNYGRKVVGVQVY
jgi:hypothetical protein